MSFGELIAPLLGRFVLAWFYFTQAYRYATDWNGTVLFLTSKGLPAAPVFLFAGLVGIVLGAISLVFGFRTRIGALMLFIITVWATLTMHNYWTMEVGSAARVTDFDIFARNIAISGGLLAMIGIGGGRFGVDGAGGGGAKKGGGGHH